MGSRASLDSALSALLSEPAAGPHAPETVSVAVKFTGPVAALEAVGFAAWTVIPHPDTGPWIAAGPIPRDRLGDLADVPGVLYVEGPRPLRAELNHTVPEIQANLVHSGNPSRQGAGVVVGIIDSGIDISHRSFRNDDGTTRVRGIWDQILPRVPGERAPTAFPGLGVEYSQADIDATLRNSEDSVPFPAGTTAVRTVDHSGHGTHVAGIAAGDGSQNGNCRGTGVYVGVAPRADLLVVRVSSNTTFGESTSTNVLHAFDWIWNHPTVVGDPTATPPVPRRPVVVNLSMGDNRGPHDGTSLVESGLDFFLTLNHGHAVVKSAGNEGATNRHAQALVPPNGTVDITFTVNKNDNSDHHIEIWFSGEDRLQITLRAPVPAGGGARRSSEVVGPNTGPVPFLANVAPAARQVTATINSRVDDPRNSACEIEIDLTTDGTLPTPKAPLLDGEWEIHLANILARSAIVDLYIGKGENGPKFTSHATRAGSLTTPGTGKMVVTVGAYAPQESFLFFDSFGDVTKFSSFGPTRDGRNKPDICAPGSKVTSVKTKTRQHCCCNCCFDFYTDTTADGGEFEGTSMAAPHVTGTIALMFEKDPTLSAFEILRILGDTARAPEVSHGSLPDTQWGAGRVSALGAVNGVVGPGPIPGPPIPGPSPAPHHPAGPSGAASPGARSGRARRGRRAPRVRTVSSAAVLQTPAGQCWAALVSRHFSEVRGLIDHNRRVATCWHRMGGPQLLRTFGPALAGTGVLTLQHDPDVFATWCSRARRFLDVLERLGSPELADAVQKHRVLLTLDVDVVLDRFFPLPTA